MRSQIGQWTVGDWSVGQRTEQGAGRSPVGSRQATSPPTFHGPSRRSRRYTRRWRPGARQLGPHLWHLRMWMIRDRLFDAPRCSSWGLILPWNGEEVNILWGYGSLIRSVRRALCAVVAFQRTEKAGGRAPLAETRGDALAGVVPPECKSWISLCHTFSAGSTKLKTLPSPALLSTHTRPLCFSITVLTMDRPSPVPVIRSVSSDSTR